MSAWTAIVADWSANPLKLHEYVYSPADYTMANNLPSKFGECNARAVIKYVAMLKGFK
jgi:hypothetical protein